MNFLKVSALSVSIGILCSSFSAYSMDPPTEEITPHTVGAQQEKKGRTDSQDIQEVTWQGRVYAPYRSNTPSYHILTNYAVFDDSSLSHGLYTQQAEVKKVQIKLVGMASEQIEMENEPSQKIIYQSGEEVPIDAIKRLTLSLNFGFPESINCFSSLNKLETLKIKIVHNEERTRLFESLKNFPHLKNLSIAIFTNLDKSQVFTPLGCLENLTSLEISLTKFYEDFSWLARLSKLQTLCFWNCYNLDRPNTLSQSLRSLREIQEVAMICNSLGNKEILDIMNVLWLQPNLKTVNFARNDMDTEGAKQLLALIGVTPPKKDPASLVAPPKKDPPQLEGVEQEDMKSFRSFCSSIINGPKAKLKLNIMGNKIH